MKVNKITGTRRKPNKYEKQFIKRHGIELYDKLRAWDASLKRSPQVFRMMLRVGELFGVSVYDFLIGSKATISIKKREK